LEYAQLAKDARLRPLVVDIDAFTMQNMFEATLGIDAGPSFALINVGASMASLNIITGGISAFTREIANGGNGITEEIKRQLGVSIEVAEGYKCGVAPEGQQVPHEVAGIVDSVLDTIAAEIQRSLDFFMATSGDGDISRIYLTGGTANIPTLAAAVERRARVPVQTWSPLQSFALDSGIDRAALDRRAAQLVVALGLTLRKDREVRQ